MFPLQKSQPSTEGSIASIEACHPTDIGTFGGVDSHVLLFSIRHLSQHMRTPGLYQLAIGQIIKTLANP